jgi:DNA-binding NtrC family response regulator
MATVSALRPVLLVEDNRDIAALVQELLQDDGYTVAWRRPRAPAQVLAEVAAVAPTCVLLSEFGVGAYGAAWGVAAELAAQVPPVPVVMFTTQLLDLQEAETQQSARSQAAAFAAILPKPFDCEMLIGVVRRAVGETVPV